MPAPVTITVGQVWRENDPRMDRYVRVQEIDSDTIYLLRVNEDGTPWTGGRIRKTRAARYRFGNKGNGYSLHREAA